jgi:TrmH family RNA methyltransferase
MLSKANIKFIKSLQVKKYRKQEQCFVIEGAKSVLELLKSDFEIVMIAATPEFLSGIDSAGRDVELIEASEKSLEDAGEFQTNNTAIAVARLRPSLPLDVKQNEFALILDDIRDPGNLGTIIRTADWYGINKIIASEETADFYNPKVISSTMGSFTRVHLFYTSLQTYLDDSKHRVFGAYLNGKNVHETDFGSGGLILIGNESHGISTALEKFVTDKITIPKYGEAESLNAAIATAVICDNLRRK